MEVQAYVAAMGRKMACVSTFCGLFCRKRVVKQPQVVMKKCLIRNIERNNLPL